MAAAASAPGYCFMEVKVSTLFNKYVGVSSKIVEKVFQIAKDNRPTLIFIDEVEDVLKNRDGDGSNKAATGVVSAMLTCVENTPGIFMIGATNVPWQLDNAFYRRLPTMHLGMPTADDIYEFLRRFFLKKDSFILTQTLKLMAQKLEGMGSSLADVKTFLGTAEKINMGIITDKSQYFRLAFSSDSEMEKWCACLPNDPRGCKKDYSDLHITSLPLTAHSIRIAFEGAENENKFKSSVPSEEVQKHIVFDTEGKAEALKSQANKEEILPGLWLALKMGKLKTREKSLFGYKIHKF